MLKLGSTFKTTVLNIFIDWALQLDKIARGTTKNRSL